MSAECAWHDTSFTKLTRTACKLSTSPLFFIFFFLVSGRNFPYVCVCGCVHVCVNLSPHSPFPVSREEGDSTPPEGWQKSILTLSFPRFPMLSRPSLPSNKG